MQDNLQNKGGSNNEGNTDVNFNGSELGDLLSKQDTRQGATSVLDLNDRFRRGLNAHSLNLALSEWNGKFSEHLKHYQPIHETVKVRVHLLDKNTYHSPISALIVVAEATVLSARKVVVSAQIISLESTVGGLQNRQVNEPGYGQAQVLTTLSDLFDDRLNDSVQKVIANSMTVSADSLDILVVGNTIVYAGVEHDDAQVYGVLAAAVNAVEGSVCDRVGGIQDPVSLKALGKHEYNVNYDYNPPANLQTPSGMVYRADATVVLSGVEPIDRKESNTYQPTSDMTRLNAYVDFVPIDSRALPYIDGKPATQLVQPRVIGTNLESLLNFNTLEWNVLNSYTLNMFAANAAWRGMVRPRAGVKGLDTRDIGALAYLDQAAAGKKVDTKAREFEDVDFDDMLDRYSTKNPLVSVLTEESGENAWIHNIYAAASMGSAGAQADILRATNNLFGGEFSKVFQGNRAVLEESFPVYTGWYTNESGQRRPLSDIGLLAVLNMEGGRNFQFVQRWLSTIYDQSRPETLRMEERYNLTVQLFPSAQIKGRGRIVTFAPDYMAALVECARRVGVTPKSFNQYVHTNTPSSYFYNDSVNYAVSSDPFRGNNSFSGGSGYRPGARNPHLG